MSTDTYWTCTFFTLRELKAAISQLELELRLSLVSKDVKAELSQLSNELHPISHLLSGDYLLLDFEKGTLSLSNELRAILQDSFKGLYQLLKALRQMYGSPGSEAEVLRLSDALRAKLPLFLDQLQAYASTTYSLHMTNLEYQWLTRSPTAIYTFPSDLSSTRIESDFCSSIVTVQRMSPLRLFKIRWNLEPIIFPSS